MKNPADDVSFEEVRNMISRCYRLEAGINRRMSLVEELKIKIVSESRRLKKQGYNIDELKPIIIKGVEE